MQKQHYINILFIILLSIVTALAYNYLRKDSLELIRKASELKETGLQEILDAASISSDTINTISLATTIQLHGKENVVFVDARDNWDFGVMHIKGAINVPEFSFEEYIDKYSKMDKSKIYVIYCDADDCDQSKRVAKYLMELSFKQIYVFVDGWQAWLQNNLPVESDE